MKAGYYMEEYKKETGLPASFISSDPDNAGDEYTEGFTNWLIKRLHKIEEHSTGNGGIFTAHGNYQYNPEPFEDKELKPYCCPVCNGRQTVSHSFYNNWGATNSTAPEICKTCNGSGVIWG